MSWRRLLWFIAFLLLAVAAVLHYSPHLGRHTPTLVNGGLALFVLGWLTGGNLVGDAD